jgi:hypothetical protein
MAKQLDLDGRRFWIMSEPEHGNWRATVLEVIEGGRQESLGLDAMGETRSAADDAAERKLRRFLNSVEPTVGRATIARFVARPARRCRC